MDAHLLPVYQQKDKILAALEEHQVIVVESPTGSGKTTQLPVILHEAGYSINGVIGVTQPRRIATVSVSDFIARQIRTTVSETVGYTIRFDDLTSDATRIKIMTDGILLQELKNDYMLSRYNVIIIDEAHERSLNIDFILGLLKYVLKKRPDFKVIISSATINAQVFADYFGQCPVVYVESLTFPVEVVYDPPRFNNSEDALLDKIGEIVSRVVKRGEPGDILIFLSGEKQIKDCISLLIAKEFHKELTMLPLYSRLSREEQEKVFQLPEPGKRKVVVATNIAETSVTIDGITVIIDSGLAKMNFYNHRTYTSSLVENPISKASCDQRKGRAGRTRPGVCYRLYTKEDFANRSLYTLEEIYRTDLAEVVLRMADLGISDFDSFDFISPPGKQGIFGGVETLQLLEALNEDNTLSDIGSSMIRFPLLPRHSRILIESINKYPDVLEETIIATSFLSTNSPFLLPIGEELNARKAHHHFRDDYGDFVSYLHLYRQYMEGGNKPKFCRNYYLDEKTMSEIANIKEQLQQIISGMGFPIASGGKISSYLCAVSRGLIQYVCVRTGRSVYRSLTAERIHIHPGSVMFKENPRFIVAGEIVRTSKMFARSVSPLHKEWLAVIFPQLSRDLPKYERSGRDRQQSAKKRDTSWQIKIGTQEFKLKPFKGKKKIVILPWEKLRTAIREVDPTGFRGFRNLRGKVILRGSDFLSGERLTTIVRVVEAIDPDRDFVSRLPAQREFLSPNDLGVLCSNIRYVMNISRMKKQSQQLGFITLCTDGNGRYWLKVSRSFTSAVERSLTSLEALIDEIGNNAGDECFQKLNTLYRRLAELYES